MNLDWKKDLETDISALDEHHKEIFRLANVFFRECDAGGGMAEIGVLLDDLENYTKKHFSYEERLQQINNYFGSNNQKTSHVQFLNDLVELRTALETNGPTKELVLITKGKLIRWLRQHIAIMDKEFAVFLKQKKS